MEFLKKIGKNTTSPDSSPDSYCEAGSVWVIASFRTLTTEQYVKTATHVRDLKLTIPLTAPSSRDKIW